MSESWPGSLRIASKPADALSAMIEWNSWTSTAAWFRLVPGILSGTGLVRAERSRVRQQLIERAQANQESTSESLVLASQPVAQSVGAHQGQSSR